MKINVQLRTESSGNYCLPVQIRINRRFLAWWTNSQQELLQDLVDIIVENSQILLHDNATNRSKKKDVTLSGKFLQMTWEMKETKARSIVLEYGNSNHFFSELTVLQVTLLVSLSPLPPATTKSLNIEEYFKT